jgi:hypothetical protein
MKNIRQNLFLAFVYNSLGVPIAAGVLYPVFGSSESHDRQCRHDIQFRFRHWKCPALEAVEVKSGQTVIRSGPDFQLACGIFGIRSLIFGLRVAFRIAFFRQIRP